MEPISLASKEYIRPCGDVGDATLRLTCSVTKETKEVKHFVLEIFEEYEVEQLINGQKVKQKAARSPRSYEALRFVDERFLHGCKKLSRSGVFHPIYEVPITDYTVTLIDKAWTGKKIISDLAKGYYKDILLRELEAEGNANRTANYKVNGKVPTGEWFEQHDAFLKSKGIVLSAYQKTASYNSCFSKAFGLLCDPGTGKTAMMVRKLDHTIHKVETKHGRQSMTLVSCPKTIRTNWMNEIDKFSMYADRIHIIFLQGVNATDRLCNFMNEASSEEAQGKHIVLITGYESFVQTKGLLDFFEFDLCLMDESHNIANPSTKRTKHYLDARTKFNSVVIATGTPFRNSPFDIFSQLEFLGKGYSGFETYQAFKNFYGQYETGWNGFTQLTGFQNIPLLQEKMARYCFIIRKEEALPELPKLTGPSLIECMMTNEQMKIYLQLADQLAAEFEAFDPNMPEEMTVNNVLTQMLRLAQITSGYAQLDDGRVNRFDPNPKLDLLVKFLKGDDDDDTGSMPGILNDPNKKALVWVCFRENVKMLTARLALEGIKAVGFHGQSDDKQGIIDQYNNDPATRVFVGIAKAGGVGLNLVGFDTNCPDKYTTNTTDNIYYSSDWSAVNRDQSSNRGHRMITRVPVHITDLVVPNSIDIQIFERVKDKLEMSKKLQDVRAILKAITDNFKRLAA